MCIYIYIIHEGDIHKVVLRREMFFLIYMTIPIHFVVLKIIIIIIIFSGSAAHRTL
jgi:hypothetical protein